MSEKDEVCCPPFDPGPWDGKEITWQDRPFVKDRVRSFLHVPLNFGSVMRRNAARIEAAGAMPEAPIVLADENSLRGADGVDRIRAVRIIGPRITYIGAR